MTAKVYDFRTGQLCKKCTSCKYWKGVKDFPKDLGGLYERSSVCRDCTGKELFNEVDVIQFTMDGDDNEVA